MSRVRAFRDVGCEKISGSTLVIMTVAEISVLRRPSTGADVSIMDGNKWVCPEGTRPHR